MKMDRCIAFNNKNKRCRAKLNNNQFFCCENHKPINENIIEDGCFICCEKFNSINDLYYFKCKHIVHKQCYDEWLKYSNYSTKICMICRGEVFKKPPKRINIRPSGVLNKNEYKKLSDILNIINK